MRLLSAGETIDDYLPSIRKVTPEDIQRVAKQYLIPDNRTVGILIPLPPKEGKACTRWIFHQRRYCEMKFDLN